jgi:putative transcriptional regulator
MITVNLDTILWERHMKLSELSEKIGISMTNLSLLKTGKGRAIRFTTLNKLCKVLDCRPGDILDYQPDPEGTEMEKDIYED